ncbi:MAG TPA: cupin domain-containing protein [Balneolales bacterium]|nr:cupin domain-containing protein [Balneolales bacterium]
MNIISTDKAEHYIWAEKCDGWHLAKSPNLSVIEEQVPPGGTEVKHYHTKSEQFFYMLSGIAIIEADGQIHELNTNQGLHIPAGIQHQLRNNSDENIRFLVISTPPSHGDRVIVS